MMNSSAFIVTKLKRIARLLRVSGGGGFLPPVRGDRTAWRRDHWARPAREKAFTFFGRDRIM